jgi:hypothetical protein
MIGFAVTSFFVSFAWLDPIYVMAAFLTGLYVATREHLAERDLLGIGRTTPVPSSGTTRGWRVRYSAQFFPTITPT